MLVAWINEIFAATNGTPEAVVDNSTWGRVETFTDHFGIPFVLLIATGYFMVRILWPFLALQFDKVQAAREAELKTFLNTVEAARHDYLDALGKRDEAFKPLIATLNELSAEVRAVRISRERDKS
jgi:hypothetical protein